MGASDGITKYDPKYVKVIGQHFYTDEEGKTHYNDIPMRPCSDEAWARFHTPDKNAQIYLDYIKDKGPGLAQAKDAFLCMDLNETNSIIKPDYSSGLTIAYLPCDKVESYTRTDGSYEADPECILDPVVRKDYLDTDQWEYYQTFLYFNYEYFDSEQFGDESV